MDKAGLDGSHKIVEAAAWLIIAVLLTIVLKTLDFILIPLCFALLVCYALGIPMDFLKRLKVPKHLRILILVVGILLVVYLFGSLVGANIDEFQKMLPVFEKQFWKYTQGFLSMFNISPEQASEGFNAFLENLKLGGIKSVSGVVRRFSGSFFSFLGSLIWVLLFMMFILAERESFQAKVVKVWGEPSSVLEVFERINKSIQYYLGLKTLISLITGTLVSITLYLFGVPFALLWGVLAFVLNYIPNIGSFIAVLPPVAITLFHFGSVGRTIGVLCVLIAIQMVMGNVVEPKVMGKGLNLSPLVVLFSLLFWGWLWGISGMLLSVPMTAVLKIALEQLDRTHIIAVLMEGN